MVIGCLRLTLLIPENASLKDKRAVIRRLQDRVRNRFNIAVAEVATQDMHETATLGIVCVSNDAAHNHSVLMNVLHFIEEMALDAEIQDVETEIVRAF